MTKLARSLFACSEFVPSSPVRSLFGVCSEFVRSLSGVGSEFVRSSEFARSLFGVCSELVHEKPGASEKRLLRKNTFCSVFCSVWPKPKKCAHAGFVADRCFLCENSQLPQLQARSAKIRAEFGLQHNAFCSYRRGGFHSEVIPGKQFKPFPLGGQDSFLFRRPQTRFSRRVKLSYS